MTLPKEKATKGLLSSLNLAFQLGYTIAIPLVLLALAGRMLDSYFGTSPWLLLTGILISMLISSWAIYFKIIKILNEMTKSERPRLTSEKTAKNDANK
ncbi:MAG: AtpZ/AtpI family protein [Patescibacteria group bacterium]